MTTQYPRKSVGHILHHLRELGVPETITGSVIVDDKAIHYGEKLFCVYKYFDGIEQPLFYFRGYSYINNSVTFDMEKHTAKPHLHLSLYVHNTPSLVVVGQLATQSLREFLLGMMTNLTIDPRYKIRTECGAFFQGGSAEQSEDTDMESRFIFIEFAIPEGAQAFVDYVNENFAYELDKLLYPVFKFRNEKPVEMTYPQE